MSLAKDRDEEPAAQGHPPILNDPPHPTHDVASTWPPPPPSICWTARTIAGYAGKRCGVSHAQAYAYVYGMCELIKDYPDDENEALPEDTVS